MSARLNRCRFSFFSIRCRVSTGTKKIDRLQGHDPEGEADGSGWRRWLGGLQEPLSPGPGPTPVEVSRRMNAAAAAAAACFVVTVGGGSRPDEVHQDAA